jgi:hypothetical protein
VLSKITKKYSIHEIRCKLSPNPLFIVPLFTFPKTGAAVGKAYSAKAHTNGQESTLKRRNSP